MGAMFTKFDDWVGDFYGSYDGRLARLRVVQDAPNVGDPNMTLSFAFTDLERDASYAFKYVSLRYGQKTFLLQGIKVEPSGGSGEALSWPYLTIHTWDIDYISGVSFWQGKPYGMSFHRTQTAPAQAPGKRFQRATDFIGFYHGHLDGRNAHLAIWGGTPSEGALYLGMMLRDLGRGTTYRTDFLRTDPVLYESTIPNLSLGEVKEDGNLGGEPLNWAYLSLHTRNTSFLSGLTEWRNLFYGMSFERIA